LGTEHKTPQEKLLALPCKVFPGQKVSCLTSSIQWSVPASLLQMMSVGQKFNNIGVGKVSEKGKNGNQFARKTATFSLTLM
jgi:hypothetical protein